MFGEKKLYQCSEEGCNNKQPILSKGKCSFHAKKKLSKIPKKIEKDTELDDFFNHHIGILSRMPYSEHSGVRIKSVDRKNIAHILPKRYFKSVQCDHNNVLYLTWGEHSQFDNLLDKMDFLRLSREFEMGWEIAKSRLRVLLPKVPYEERNNYWTKLNEYIKTHR